MNAAKEPSAEAAPKREAFRKVLSANVEVHYGYKNARALVRVRLPIPFRPWYSVEIPADSIVRFKRNFDDAHEFGLRPESERAKMENPAQFEAREDCRGRWGYQDAHVELDVKRGIWITLTFPFDEFKLAKAAMDEAHMWAQLPADVREMQGVE